MDSQEDSVRSRKTLYLQIRVLIDFFLNNAMLIAALGALATMVTIASTWDWEYWAEQTVRDGRIVELKLDRARIVQQIALVAFAFPALIFAIWRTVTAHRQANAALSQAGVALKQAELAVEGQFFERYANAARMLDSSQSSVRRAGLFALSELGIDKPQQYYRSTVELLAGFARDISIASPETRTPDEVELALFQITKIRRNAPDAQRYDLFRVDLSSLKIAERVYIHLQLSRAIFNDSTFSSTQIVATDLRGCLFSDVRFDSSRFSECDLTGSTFNRATLSEHLPVFKKCNISKVNLTETPGINEKHFEESWAWSDRPPFLPTNVKFSNYFDPGPGGTHRDIYDNEKSLTSFPSPPDDLRLTDI